MTYYSLTARNGNSYTLPNQNTGVLLANPNGEILQTESGLDILIDNPTTVGPNTSRNSSTYTLPNRN